MVEKLKLPVLGVPVGLVLVIMAHCGNPFHLGLCIACFLRDISGSLGFHSFVDGRYMRPEIPGLILGSFIVSLVTKEFAVKGGSAPLTRFALGICIIVGAFIFLGCPTAMLLRMARGDLNALVGLFGFAAGVLGGMFFLNKGFSLGRTYNVSKSDGAVLPFISVLLLMALLFVPSILNFSEGGFASFRAPIFISLGGGLIIGGIAFIGRICTVAAVRDSVFFKNFSVLFAILAMMAVVTAYNLISGVFSPSFDVPYAHSDGLWNFLGMTLVGFIAVLIGGCPFRQLILAGSGNSDAAVTVFGMAVGSALVHNLNLASTSAAISERGPVGFAIAAAVAVTIALYNTFFNKKARNN